MQQLYFTQDITSCTANFTIHLDTITEDLKLMSDNVLVSGHNVHDILSRFQLSDIQHKITKSLKEISSCKVMSIIVNIKANVSRCRITNSALFTKSTTLSFIYDDLRIATVVDNVFKSSMTLSTVPVR
jgi:hypothetical protein